MPKRQQPKLAQQLPEAISKKADRLIRLVAAVYPEEIEDAVVSTSLTGSDGDYGSIWLFTKNLIGEIHEPFSTPKTLEFDMIPYTNKIDNLYVTTLEFDMRKAISASRFKVEFSTVDGNSGEIAVAGDDCLYLKAVLKKWFYPNLAVG